MKLLNMLKMIDKNDEICVCYEINVEYANQNTKNRYHCQ